MAMTEQLRHAFERAQELPEEDQDRFAAWLLEEIDGELRWNAVIQGSEDTLNELAEQARSEDEAGLSVPLEDVLEAYRRHGRFLEQ